MITKENLLEIIKDMPMDAEICVRDFDYEGACNRSLNIDDIIFDEADNAIVIW